MSRISFLSIPKAEVKHINAVAAKYLRTNFPSSHHASISSVKAVPLSVSQASVFEPLVLVYCATWHGQFIEAMPHADPEPNRETSHFLHNSITITLHIPC